MQISSRFTIAIHILTCIDIFGKEYKTTSEFLASSVNVNPVVIRRLLQQLKAAGLVEVTRGSGGAAVSRPLDEITFYDVYKAVECVEDDTLFHFHENPSISCPVGRNIHKGLDDKLLKVQESMENEMKRISVKDVVNDTKKYVLQETSS